MKTCDKCCFAFMQDNGYSNWTVEGTEFICVKNVHPDGQFDRFYVENPKLEFAEKCKEFEVGEAFQADVEGEWKDEPSNYKHPAVKYLKTIELITNKPNRLL